MPFNFLQKKDKNVIISSLLTGEDGDQFTYELEEIDSEEDAGLAKLPDKSKQSILLLMLTFCYVSPTGCSAVVLLIKRAQKRHF